MVPHGTQVLRDVALLMCQNASGKKIQKGRDSTGDKCDPRPRKYLPYSGLLQARELKAVPSPALTKLVKTTPKSL